jgi:thiamine-phosphate pyrophosphorylase
MTIATAMRLTLVTDQLSLGRKRLRDIIARAVAEGVTSVCLADRKASSQELFNTAKELSDMLKPFGVPLVVHDRVDVAVAAGAHGVHLDQASIPAVAARAIIGPKRTIGFSITAVSEVAQSPLDVIDYLSFAATYEARSRNPAAIASYIEQLRTLHMITCKPLVAAGYICPADTKGIVGAGAIGVAVHRDVLETEEHDLSARKLRCALETALAHSGKHCRTRENEHPFPKAVFARSESGDSQTGSDDGDFVH